MQILLIWLLIVPLLTALSAKEKFKNTLLIVRYNFHPPITVVRLHYNIWKHVFVHQAVYALWSDSQIAELKDVSRLWKKEQDEFISYSNKTEVIREQVEVNYNETLYFGSIADTNGLFAYGAIISAMSSFPNYEGYLYAHDDAVMNLTSLKAFDLQKPWFTSFSILDQGSWSDNKVGLTWQGSWSDNSLGLTWNQSGHSWGWDRPDGIPAMKKTLLNTKILEGLRRCHNSEYTWNNGQSDVFYIPQVYKEQTIDILTLFFAAGLHVEIAIPTFGTCFLPKNISQVLSLCTHFPRLKINDLERDCKSADIYHPAKLMNHEENVKFHLKLIGIL